MRDDNAPNTVTHLNDDNKYWVAFRQHCKMICELNDFFRDKEDIMLDINRF